MDPKRRAEVAAMGGIAAHKSGNARTFSPGEEAVEAGRKGGKARARNQRRNRA